MLLFLIVKLFLLAEVQGKIVKECLHIDDHCSNNDDCCSHKCLYSTKSSNFICVSEVETSLDSPLALPIVFDNFCFYYRVKCSTDRDCYCSQKCLFTNGKSGDGYCSTAVPKSLNRQATTVLSVENPESCTLLGSACSENTDCCSNKCGRGAGKYYHACVPNTNDSFDKNFFELQPIIAKPALCIISGHFCVANNDCCTKKCATSARNPRFHYCQFADRL